MEQTKLGLENRTTNRPTDRPTDQTTDENKYDPFPLLNNKIISFLAEVTTKNTVTCAEQGVFLFNYQFDVGSLKNSRRSNFTLKETMPTRS